MMARELNKLGGQSLIDVLLDEVANRLAEKLAERGRGSKPRHADARNNPLGGARVFLAAARRDAFPTFRRGRAVVALWTDVEAYIEHQPISRKRRDLGLDEDRALLESAGVRLRRS